MRTRRYTSLLKHSFMLLACRLLVGEPGRSFLREDLGMVCYENEHLIWALGVAISVFIGDERIYVKTILVVLLCLVSFALQVMRIKIRAKLNSV
jgi:hypothetical protein